MTGALDFRWFSRFNNAMEFWMESLFTCVSLSCVSPYHHIVCRFILLGFSVLSVRVSQCWYCCLSLFKKLTTIVTLVEELKELIVWTNVNQVNSFIWTVLVIEPIASSWANLLDMVARSKEESLLFGLNGVQIDAKTNDEKQKTTAHSIPVWSPTTVLTVPSPA